MLQSEVRGRSLQPHGDTYLSRYRLIINSVKYVEIYRACVIVSIRFSKIYLSSFSIIEGLKTLPNEVTTAYTHVQEA